MIGFRLENKKIDPMDLIFETKFLALNKFQRKFIESVAGWAQSSGREITSGQLSAINKTLSKVRLYESCIDYPCCGHSQCRVHTIDRVTRLINVGIIPLKCK